MNGQGLLPLFLRLAPIDGVSHKERAVADEVSAILRQAGVRVVEDNSARLVKGDTGNLLCFPPTFDPNVPSIMLTAHLDTVQSTSALKVLVTEDRVTSDGRTILGADNRMGLAILVDLLLRVAGLKDPHRNFFVVFTVCEETGLNGADALDLSPYNVTASYVFDCSRRPGVYIREAAGIRTFSAEFIGKASHAGVAPEQGVSAIALSSAAIARLRLGRIDADTTANIGKIHGGQAVNVVPAKVKIEGEVRSFSLKKIEEQLRQIKGAFQETVDGIGGVVFNSTSSCDPYVHAPDSHAVLELERALRTVGLTPEPIRYMGGSDANKHNAKGIPAVNIGIGAQKPHSTEEFFFLSDLHKSAKIARELVSIQK